MQSFVTWLTLWEAQVVSMGLFVLLQATPPVTSFEEFIIRLFDTEHILSGLLVVIVIFGGRWFGRVAWPDIMTLLRAKEDRQKRLAELELEAQAERDKRATENDQLMLQTIIGVKGEERAMVAILGTQQTLLIHILQAIDGTGKLVTNALDEAVSESAHR